MNEPNWTTVSASTQAVTGVDSTSFGRNTTTDATGAYRLVVLSGTNYTLGFFPPVPMSMPSQYMTSAQVLGHPLLNDPVLRRVRKAVVVPWFIERELAGSVIEPVGA